MTKKLVALALAAIVTANVSAVAPSHANFAEAVTEFVAVAKEAGLSDKQIAEELVVQSTAPALTPKQKNILIGTAVVVAAGVVVGTLYYKNMLPGQTAPAANPAAANPAAANPAAANPAAANPAAQPEAEPAAANPAAAE